MLRNRNEPKAKRDILQTLLLTCKVKSGRPEIDLSSKWGKMWGCPAKRNRREKIMKTYYTVGLSMLAGIGIGAVAVQTLQAQSKPGVFYVAEINVKDLDAYTKE